MHTGPVVVRILTIAYVSADRFRDWYWLCRRLRRAHGSPYGADQNARADARRMVLNR